MRPDLRAGIAPEYPADMTGIRKKAWKACDPYLRSLPTEPEAILKHPDVKDFAQTTEQNRGRFERRSCIVVDASSLPREVREALTVAADEEVRSVIRITRYRERPDKRFYVQQTGADGKQSYLKNPNETKTRSSEETVYYLSNACEDAAWFLERIRAHWKIESGLHWSLDVAFGEDDWRVREKKVAQNLATLRKMAFNLLKKETSSSASLRVKMKKAAWEPTYLEKVVFQSVEF